LVGLTKMDLKNDARKCLTAIPALRKRWRRGKTLIEVSDKEICCLKIDFEGVTYRHFHNISVG
jgi:hypothetical protein